VGLRLLVDPNNRIVARMRELPDVRIMRVPPPPKGVDPMVDDCQGERGMAFGRVWHPGIVALLLTIPAWTGCLCRQAIPPTA
jgi:hypothetical protein